MDLNRSLCFGTLILFEPIHTVVICSDDRNGCISRREMVGFMR